MQHLPNQQSIQHTQKLVVTNSQPFALLYDHSQVIVHIPQAIDQGQVSTEYIFCMICMTYFKTFKQLQNHMVRFLDELGQEESGN